VAAKESWSVTPTYLLRRSCIRDVTTGWPAGRFLEIGAGTGSLTRDFLDRGSCGTCFDLGAASRESLSRNLTAYGDRVQIVATLDLLPERSYRHLFAFEVLEHVEDDLGALRSWSRHLECGGRVLVSVPAHPRLFSADDIAMGHLRRYRRDQLYGLLSAAGYRRIEIHCYGYPLGVWTAYMKRPLFALGLLRPPPSKKPARERSIDSGVQRFPLTRLLSRTLSPALLAPFLALQRRFYASDLGTGFVASGVLSGRAR